MWLPLAFPQESPLPLVDECVIVTDKKGTYAVTITGEKRLVHDKPLDAVAHNEKSVSVAINNKVYSGANFAAALLDKTPMSFPDEVEVITMSPTGKFAFVTTRHGLYYCNRWNRRHQRIEDAELRINHPQSMRIPYTAAAFISETKFLLGIGPDLYTARLGEERDPFHPGVFPGFEGVARICAVGFVGYGQGASTEIAFVKSVWVHKSGRFGGAAHRMGGSGWEAAFTAPKLPGKDDYLMEPPVALDRHVGYESMAAADAYWATWSFGPAVRVFSAADPKKEVLTLENVDLAGWLPTRILPFK